MYKCVVCGKDFEAKKEAKTCSRNCRVTLSRKGGNVTRNVTLEQNNEQADVTPNFKFRIVQSPDPEKRMESKDTVREASYWYDVPLAAIPIYQKDWPKMPEYMNGRQYFLWWKNDFKMNNDSPVIHNPFVNNR